MIISIPNQFYQQPSYFTLLSHRRRIIELQESFRVLQSLDTGINGSAVTHLSARYDSRRRMENTVARKLYAFDIYR